MQVLETEQLILRHFCIDDAEFIIRLLNEPSFIKRIGDKGVRSGEDAKQYLLSGAIDSYDRFGQGLNMVELKKSGEPVGMCDLVKREYLDDADIAYALLEQHWSQGYAAESAEGVMRHARETLNLQRILAIVSPDNHSSTRLFEKIGLTFERMNRRADDDEELKVFVSDSQ